MGKGRGSVTIERCVFVNILFDGVVYEKIDNPRSLGNNYRLGQLSLPLGNTSNIISLTPATIQKLFI